MTTGYKIAQKRLILLQLAEQLRNVSETCRRYSISRSQISNTSGPSKKEGSRDFWIVLPYPRAIPTRRFREIRDKIIAFSLKYPAWSSARLSNHLPLEGISVSASTVRNLRIKEKMETEHKRLLRLEEEQAGPELELTEEQIRLLGKANPCFRERHAESPSIQDTFMAGVIKGISRSFLGRLWVRMSPLPSGSSIVPRSRRLWWMYSMIGHVLTDNGREYFGKAIIHPSEIFLEFIEIEHRRTQLLRPRTNGFVERFNPTVLDEFFRGTFRDRFYVSIEELQENLDKWPEYCNY